MDVRQIAKRNIIEMPKGRSYADLKDWDVVRLASGDLGQIVRPIGNDYLVRIVEAEIDDIDFLNEYLQG